LHIVPLPLLLSLSGTNSCQDHAKHPSNELTSPLTDSPQAFHSKQKMLVFHKSHPDSSSSSYLHHHHFNSRHHPPQPSDPLRTWSSKIYPPVYQFSFD